MDKRLERGLSTREDLVSAAVLLFARDGYEATSVEVVLKHTGISRGALYHHFDNKQALFEAALRRVHADAVQATIDAARGADDGVVALKAGCVAWIKMARDPKVSRIVLIDAPAVVGWQRWRDIDNEHSFGVVRAGLNAAARRGLVPEALVEPLGHVLLATLNELALLIVVATDAEAAELSALATLDLFLERLFRQH
jgi:AcrR family transcriptional regulator